MSSSVINRKNLSEISNSLKNQIDYSKITDKYAKVNPKKSEPTELQKYYTYLTETQPILDELNYVNERMKTEDVKKMKEDFIFLETLKKQRENELLNQKNIDKQIEFDEKTRADLILKARDEKLKQAKKDIVDYLSAKLH
jgi:hypothetical protein